MIKKEKKFICIKTCFFTLLILAFFCFHASKTLAADLEVQYPKIAEQTITAESKLPDFVLYLFNFGMYIGFFSVIISLVVAGVMYFLSPLSSEILADAKDRINSALSGLLLLTLTYLITTTINPQLKDLDFSSLEPAEVAPVEVAKAAPGVYFYNQGGCSTEGVTPKTASIPDLGEGLRKRVNSVNIVHNTTAEVYYITILYENPNFWGKCQYINPNSGCSTVANPFASSASIYEYDFDPVQHNPTDGGVYFFRKSCFNNESAKSTKDLISYCKQNSGGYFYVSNSEIKGIYSSQKLDTLKFINVPEEEKTCVKYDANGKCTRREAPSLSGENISSMIINGKYLVSLVYFSPTDSSSGPWTSCQEFPTADDFGKLGPRQIKWQNIRNPSGATGGGAIPNYILIFPIKN